MQRDADDARRSGREHLGTARPGEAPFVAGDAAPPTSQRECGIAAAAPLFFSPRRRLCCRCRIRRPWQRQGRAAHASRGEEAGRGGGLAAEEGSVDFVVGEEAATKAPSRRRRLVGRGGTNRLERFRSRVSQAGGSSTGGSSERPRKGPRCCIRKSSSASSSPGGRGNEQQ